MNILIWKEFKENFKYALAGYLIIGFLMTFASLNKMGYSLANNGSIVTDSWLYFQILGAVLGFAQTYPELKRDRWSFLCHRSQSITMIFFSKIIVGLIYFIGTFVSLLLFSAWILSTAEKVFVPFYWRDLQCSASFLFTGIMIYFATFLCGIRQKKWYGTRYFPLITSFFFSTTLFAMAANYGNLSVGMIIPPSLLASVLLGITCYSHFTRSLEENRKSLFTRIIHVTTMYLISFPIQFLAAMLLLAFLFSLITHPNQGISYVYGKDGNTYQIKNDRNRKKLISIKDVYYPDRNLNISDFEINDNNKYFRIQNQLDSHSLKIKGNPDLVTLFYASSNNYRPLQLFSSIGLGNDDSNSFRWYYVFHENRILGCSYESKEHKVIDCDFEKLIQLGESQSLSIGFNNSLLTTKNNGFYLFDVKGQRILPLPESKIDQPIRSMEISLNKESKRTLILHEDTIAIHEALPRVLKENGEQVEPKLAPKEMASWTNNDEPRYYHPDGFYPMNTIYIPGKEIARIPFMQSIPDYTSIDLVKVPDENRYLMNIERNCWQDIFWPGDPFKTYLELNEEGEILKKNQLNSSYNAAAPFNGKHLIGAVGLPVAPLFGILAYDAASSTEPDEFYGTSYSARFHREPLTAKIFVGAILVSCLLASALTFLIGRKYSFTKKQLRQWMLFNFLLGWGGVLTMVACHQWVKKTTCTSCGKKRIQTNVHCEYCGAEFPLPLLDGTEIIVDSRRIVPVAEISSNAS